MAGRPYAGDANKAEAPPTAEIATEAQRFHGDIESQQNV